MGDRVRLRAGLTNLRRLANSRIQQLGRDVGVITSFEPDGEARVTFGSHSGLRFALDELEMASDAVRFACLLDGI